MTAIVGFTNGKTVWIGGDSAVSDGEDFVLLGRDEKVFKTGKLIIGCSGDVRAIQIIRYNWQPPPLPKSRKQLTRYMCSTFVKSLRKAIEEGYKEQASVCFSILVGVWGRIFEVSDDYSVVEPIDSVAAVGSGRDIAIGSLLTSSPKAKPETRIAKALSAAATRNPSVQPPWVIISG